MTETQRIIDFVRSIGIPVHEKSLPDSTFLPGITISRGELIVDREKLAYPGDLLHEAGHIAIVPPSERSFLSDNLDSDGGEEMAAIAWSYAAIVQLELPPSVLFHDEGYKGGAANLLENFSSGRYIGVPLLEWYGMTISKNNESGGPGYPRMANWLRITENAEPT